MQKKHGGVSSISNRAETFLEYNECVLIETCVLWMRAVDLLMMTCHQRVCSDVFSLRVQERCTASTSSLSVCHTALKLQDRSSSKVGLLLPSAHALLGFLFQPSNDRCCGK